MSDLMSDLTIKLGTSPTELEVRGLEEHPDYEDLPREVLEPGVEGGNLIGSALYDSELHAPALDLDFPCTLVPSKQEGHFHLYIDKPISWEAYKDLLKALLCAGLIQQRWYNTSLRAGMTHLRARPEEKVV